MSNLSISASFVLDAINPGDPYVIAVTIFVPSGEELVSEVPSEDFSGTQATFEWTTVAAGASSSTIHTTVNGVRNPGETSVQLRVVGGSGGFGGGGDDVILEHGSGND